MGRNTPSLRIEIDRIIEEIRKMEKVMRKEDAELLEDIIKKAKIHTPQSSYASLDPEFSFLLSVLIELSREKK